jgi:hypothetical protein
MCIGGESFHHHHATMTRALCPLYFLEIDGIAASKIQSGAACMRELDRKYFGQAQISAFLVQVDPNTNSEVNKMRVFPDCL